jgi:ankyrin repeat protein
LIGGGADVNSQNDESSTPLHCAAMSGFLEVAEVLLNHGASVNFRDKQRVLSFLFKLHFTSPLKRGRSRCANFC